MMSEDLDQGGAWRRARASRLAFLIDIEAYYTAVYEALRAARRSILLLGWGFDPRSRLFPDGLEGPSDPDEIGNILVDIAERRPEVDIRLLIWRSALPISASQEFFPHRARSWFAGTRVRFLLDDQVPFGACHHQKVLVIDDRIAFCGGADISVDRWDTPSHLDDEPRRIMPAQTFHDARHEVMTIVEGEAAAAFGDLARERWRRACGHALAVPEAVASDPWPASVPAALRDVDVAIARTEPRWKGREGVSEILASYLQMIAAAQDTIYLENQYFASPTICEALARRLAEPDGPEIVLMSTGQSPSWFDRMTMDRARASLIWRLKAADVFGRFRAYYPTTPNGEAIIVHSKVATFDDAVARVGSANLNNRSGGFDTECDLIVEASDLDDRMVVSTFRNRLVGHFIGVTGDAVARACADRGGLIAAIEALDADGRLQRIEPHAMGRIGTFIATHHLGDPATVQDSWRLHRRRERLYGRLSA